MPLQKTSKKPVSINGIMKFKFQYVMLKLLKGEDSLNSPPVGGSTKATVKHQEKESVPARVLLF